MLESNLPGFLVGVTFILVHSCISKSLADGGVVFGELGIGSCDAKYRREVLELRAALTTYDPYEIEPDNLDTWRRLIAKDIASNAKLLQGLDPHPPSPKKRAKRAVLTQDDDLVPQAVLCENPGDYSNSTGCVRYQDSPAPTLFEDGSLLHDYPGVTDRLIGGLSPEEYREIQRAASLSASAYLSDEEIVMMPELMDKQVADFPFGYRQSSRTMNGISPTLFRVWRFRDDSSTVYVSFLGLVDKAVHFRGIDTELSPLPRSNPTSSTQSKRRHAGVSGPVPQIHKGFLHQYKLLEEHMLGKLKQLSFGAEIGRIVFTGHSIGGAIATIAGSFGKTHYPGTGIDVITFGAPRVGDDAFVEQFAENVSLKQRIVLQGDRIPNVYPIGTSFAHIPGYICLDCQREEDADFAPSSRMRLALKSLGATSLSIHDMDWYLRGLNLTIDVM